MTTTLYRATHPSIMRCEACQKTLKGYDVFFTHCDACSDGLLIIDDSPEGYCSLHPGCGCQSPDDCTEER